MMGANTQSAIFEQPDNIVMVTVDAFWMDETEITNNEYHQFVNWVRDSIAFTNLIAAGMTDYAVQPKDEDFDEENFRIDWRRKVPWNIPARRKKQQSIRRRPARRPRTNPF